MSTTQHTGHYNLPTFGDNPNDRPSWCGDFSDPMTKIDNQIHANATNITNATAASNSFCGAMPLSNVTHTNMPPAGCTNCTRSPRRAAKPSVNACMRRWYSAHSLPRSPSAKKCSGQAQTAWLKCVQTQARMPSCKPGAFCIAAPHFSLQAAWQVPHAGAGCA